MALASFLKSLKESDWASTFLAHSNEDKTGMLDEAHYVFNIMAGQDNADAKDAEKVLKEHFDLKKATEEAQKLDDPTDKSQRALIISNNISKPEIFYETYKKLALISKEDYEKWLKKIASIEDFIVLVEGDTASAKGVNGKNIHVKFMNEDGHWKIAGNWRVRLDEE